MRRLLPLLLATALLGATAGATRAQSPASDAFVVPAQAVLRIGPDQPPSRVPEPAQAEASEAAGASASFVVNYNGFTPAGQNAFQSAVNIWAHVVTSSVPIVVNANFTNLGAGVLGSAGPSALRQNFSGAPQANTLYPNALADALAGTNLPGGPASDITASFGSAVDWYYGTDGQTPPGKVDFVSVVLHELGHGLGFIGSAKVMTALGSFNNPPYIYDRFTEDGAGTPLLAMTSAQQGQRLTGNDVYFDGPKADLGAGGTRPKLYAPAMWDSGSSYSHLDESTYPAGTINSLMTPVLSAAESNHQPGPITTGIFADLGWVISGTGANRLYNPLTPVRILDTRSGAPLTANQVLTLDVTGVGGVPASGVGAVVLNVTATQPQQAGFLTVFPSLESPPVASNVNFVPGQDVPNLVIAKVGTDGNVAIKNGTTTGTTHVLADVMGWLPV